MIWKLLIAGGVGSIATVAILYGLIIYWATKTRL